MDVVCFAVNDSIRAEHRGQQLTEFFRLPSLLRTRTANGRSGIRETESSGVELLHCLRSSSGSRSRLARVNPLTRRCE